MKKPHTLILLIQTRLFLDRLQEVLNRILHQSDNAFSYDILILPSLPSLENCVTETQCLFFLEAPPSTPSQRAYNQHIIQHYRPQGHQVVLVCPSEFDYLNTAMDYNIGNILFYDSIEVSVLSALLHRLLGPDFFGFTPFFPESTPCYEYQIHLSGTINSLHTFNLFKDFKTRLQEPFRSRFHTQITELLNNAISYGVLGVTPEQRDHDWNVLPQIIEIPDHKAITIQILMDHEKYGVSVMDHGGELTLFRILEKLKRQTPTLTKPIPEGIKDLTGRGLYIVSRQTRLVINILHKRKTEVLLLSYFDEDKNKYKSFIINERYPNPKPGV